jgi:hypothetical protein
LQRILSDVEEVISLPTLLAALMRIIFRKDKPMDFKIVYYGALIKESLRVKELIRVNNGNG